MEQSKEQNMGHVLVVDDEPRILLLTRGLLTSNGYQVTTTADGASALEIVKAGGIDVVITDMRMQPMDGMALYREISAFDSEIPVILLTGYASVETAVAAMKSGVFDYLTKPFKVDEMLACLKRATEKRRKRAASVGASVSEPLRYRFENFIASSPVMADVCRAVEKVASTTATVLINGESGTGKEVVARAIHMSSQRARKAWVAVNCAAIPSELLESEMFGHVKGSFTGAVADKEGLFETANGGTLFLDEISSLPLALQGKLLRVLQEREVRRVGGTKSIPVDVRIIAASNTNLEEAVEQGTFRGDLYYRFAVITIDIPPLRERTEDILPLARHFIAAEMDKGHGHPVLSESAAKVLLSYDWPGNVRELENCIKHALAFLQGEEIGPGLLPTRIVGHHTVAAAHTPPTLDPSRASSLKDFLKRKEREYIGQVVHASGGDKEKAAKTLKVNLSTLYRKLTEEE